MTTDIKINSHRRERTFLYPTDFTVLNKMKTYKLMYFFFGCGRDFWDGRAKIIGEWTISKNFEPPTTKRSRIHVRHWCFTQPDFKNIDKKKEYKSIKTKPPTLGVVDFLRSKIWRISEGVVHKNVFGALRRM